MIMKKMLFAIMLGFAFTACTKHDPFDNIVGNPDAEEPLWILSRFLPENYQNANGDEFFSYDDLKNVGLLEAPVPAGEGFCRVPSSGELQMIFPHCDDPVFLGQYNMWLPLNHAWSPVLEGIAFKETAFLDNKDDCSADPSGEIVSGDSEFYYASEYEDGDPDFIPNFALRFKGTTQYAAYMYQIKVKDFDTHTEYVLNLKAKWLREKDVTTKMEDIIRPEYWESDFLELEFPLESYWDSDGVMADICGRLISSTLEDGDPVLGSFSLSQSGMEKGDVAARYNLRMIRCKEDGKL
jgi:hypothetical protein